MNKVIEARQAVYRRLYERRVDAPRLFFSLDEFRGIAAEPYLSSAMDFGQEMGHLEEKRGDWRMSAAGMLYAESEGFVEGVI